MKRIALLALLGALTGCGGSQTQDTPPTENVAPPEHPPAPPSEEAPSEPAPQASPTPPPSATVDATAAELALLAQGNQFAFDLYGQLKTRPGNLVVSPASIGVALAMTYGGARGETATQMASTLHLGTDADAIHRAYGTAIRTWNATDTATLRVANRIYVDNSVPVEGPFLALTRDAYGAEAQRVDFANQAEAVRAEINGWVEQQTERRIRDLLPTGSLDALTRLVLTNAVYFKGTWQTQFDPQRTQPHTFAIAGGGLPSVSMMNTKARFRYARHQDGLRILEMPYAGGDLQMVWLLPEQSDGFAAMEGRLSVESLARWRAAAREVEVEVGIPRFRLEPPTTALSDTLQAMGMRLPFDESADFTGMARLADGLYISEVFHKAFIEVNEEGTEAAAATAVVMVTRGMAAPAPEPPRFMADHPFVFLLMDQRTGAIMFIGRVTDPR